jgi:enterochelin esterase-like enzyme
MLYRRALLAVGAAAICLPASAAAPLPKVRFGRLKRLPTFFSKHIGARTVDVWLPPGYERGKPQAVLYMHDGQMLFDPTNTWNQQAWEVDQVAAPLIESRRVRPFIVVAIHNHGSAQGRFAEYFPQAWLRMMSSSTRQRMQNFVGAQNFRADDYLKFLVHELMPKVDQTFGSGLGRADQYLMGSSMGGLISCYGLCEYPEVFAGAALLSTHWIGGFEQNDEVPSAAVEYLARNLPSPERVRVWMDRGDQELDAQYIAAQSRIDALMSAKGFRTPGFVSKTFAGAGHNERAWRARLHEPLMHLFAD